MSKYRLLYLLLAIFGMSALTMGDANAATVKKVAPAKAKKLTKAQQAEQARLAAEAKAGQEAKARAAQEAEAQAEAEAKARAEAEAKAMAEADEKARREAEIAAREKSITDAEAMMKDGKPAEAYELLEPLEFERSGEVRFDYLLGIAALDSGKSDKATLAFERVLAVDPNFAGARMDMARAYYQLGDLPRAQTEFETVLKANPPDAARATIQKYLAAIDSQMHAKDNRLTGYLEGVVGHDSNVNTATSEGQVAVPALGNLVFTLNQASLKNADDYVGWAGGLNLLHPVNATVALYAGADLRQRGNMVMTQFDTINMNGTAGGIFNLGKQDSLKLGLVDGQYTLGGARYYGNAGVNGEWRHVFSPANQLSVFGQQLDYRFVNSAQYTNNNVQDFTQSVEGLSWTHVMADGKSMTFGSLYLGQEHAGLRPDGGKNFTGLRAGGQSALNDKTEFFANVGLNDGNYSQQNVLFLNTRHDTLYDATLGVNWHWDKLWTLRPQISWTHNYSNIPIYGYDRTDLSVAIRRNFN